MKKARRLGESSICEVPGGRTSAKNESENSIQRKTGSKSVFGGSWGRFWSHLGVILESKSVRKLSEHELDLEVDFKRPNRGTRSSEKGSARLETDRRGGVGEG